MNILAACTFYDVELLKLDKQLYDKLAKEYDIDADCPLLRISETDIEFHDIPVDAVDWDSCEFDEYGLEDIMEGYVGKYPHYLVFASGCRWNGSSGYKLCDNILQTVYRDYDISLEFVDKGKRKAAFIESSHDVPTGSTTYIVGLTNREYNKLVDAEFEEVESFIEQID